MMAAVLLAVLTAQGGLFDVTSVPVEGWSASAFVDIDGDGLAELCVWRNTTLEAYRIGHASDPVTIDLEEGTQAFDITDIDGDGKAEVVAVCNKRVMRYPLSPSGEPEELFSLESPWPAEAERPYPHVIGVEHEGEILLAVSSENAVELRRLNGELVESFPLRPNKRVIADNIRVYPYSQLCPDPSTGLCMVIREDVELKADLPPELEPPEEEDDPEWPHGSLGRARRATDKKPELWPWFPLRSDGGDKVRVLYAQGRHTQIRLRTKADELPSRAGDGITLGPPQTFPGTIVPPVRRVENLPDFNGDGYVDLVVWTTPQPGMSVDSLTRSALGRDWPIRLFVHLFSPEKNRYEPRPAASIKFRIPIPWLMLHLGGTPFENCVFGDFNGDGRGDVGLSTDDDSFSVWLYDDGFAKNPDETHKFPESLDGAWGPRPGRPGEIFLVSEHYIHLLTARQGARAGK